MIVEDGLKHIVWKRPAFTHVVYLVSRYGESAVDKPGLVHLWEHMLERPTETIASRIERIGGIFDAETFFDYTSMAARLVGASKKSSSSYFSAVKELPTLRKEEDLELERDAVLIEEAWRNLSEPSGYVSTMLFRRMYGPNCPLGWTYEDIEDSLYNTTLEDIARLHESALGVNSAFMLTTGNVSEIPEPIELPPGKIPPMKEFYETGKRGLEELDGNHEGVSYVSMAADIKDISDVDSAVAVLIERYLSAHTDAVLYGKLRLEKGLVYDISAQMYAMRGLNVFVLEFESVPKNVHKTIDEIFEELEMLADGDVDEQILEYSRNNLLGSMYRAYEELMSAGGSLIRNEAVRNDAFWELREGEKIIKSITKEQITEFADRYLRSDRFYVEVLNPKKS